jgi:hypothetical protein
LNPIYITEFSVNKDKFTFTVPEVIEVDNEQIKKSQLIDNTVNNQEGIEALHDGYVRGVLFDDVFSMYLVEDSHIILRILVDKCHIQKGIETIGDENYSTFECMMSRRGLIIHRV